VGSSWGCVEPGSTRTPKDFTPRLGGAPRVPPYVSVEELCAPEKDSHTPKPILSLWSIL